ncbi:DUF4339 domain-containing protein [Candidatus Dependentiae bacterium]|nr:DUF4339 domain-containing protein [Candidatus Dependentiae bacterium]
MKVYYIYLNEEQKGPFDINEISSMLHQNIIDMNTYIWKEGFETWVLLSELNEFQITKKTSDSIVEKKISILSKINQKKKKILI